MTHKDLSDQDKLTEAIKFVAIGQPLPEALKSFLVEAGLHDSVTQPGVLEQETYIDTDV